MVQCLSLQTRCRSTDANCARSGGAGQ
uniref:Uncharacterized protein n=1 Tax=Arundo donax TaxID=35708 RepID=A0A0A9DMK2_ARUDO